MSFPTLWNYQVYKHELTFEKNGRCCLKLPEAAQIVKCDMHGGRLCLWEMHFAGETKTEMREFFIIATEQTFTESGDFDHIATVFDREHTWHIFELLPV